MPCLRVSIIRFVDEHQPGFVECEFTDANGTVHTLVDKVPVFSLEDLWNDSVYPQPGFARCDVLERSQDSRGHKLARVTIAKPDGLARIDEWAFRVCGIRVPNLGMSEIAILQQSTGGLESCRAAQMQESRQVRRGRLAQEIARKRHSLYVMKISQNVLPSPMRERCASPIQTVTEELQKMEAEYHELNVRQIREELKGGKSEP
jgi:hypothetical protein